MTRTSPPQSSLCFALLLAPVLCVAMYLPAHASAANEAAATDADRYRVLVDRNIFSRTRGSALVQPRPTAQERPSTIPREAPPPRDPGAAFVLRGIAIASGQAVALVEDDAGALRQVRTDETLANLRVVSISLDQMVMQHDDESQRVIAIGMTLAGEQAARPSGGRSTATPPGSGVAASGSMPANAQSILERLRQRRQQRLGPSAEPDGPSQVESASPAAPDDDEPAPSLRELDDAALRTGNGSANGSRDGEAVEPQASPTEQGGEAGHDAPGQPTGEPNDATSADDENDRSSD